VHAEKPLKKKVGPIGDDEPITRELLQATLYLCLKEWEDLTILKRDRVIVKEIVGESEKPLAYGGDVPFERRKGGFNCNVLKAHRVKGGGLGETRIFFP